MFDNRATRTLPILSQLSSTKGLGCRLSGIILFPGFPTDCSSRSFFTSWRSLVITTNRGLWVLAGTQVWPETVFEQNLTKFFTTGKRFYFGWTVYLGCAIPFGFRWTLNSVADHFRFSHWDLWFKFQFLTISSVFFQASGNTEIADESWSVRGFDSRVFSTEGNIRFIPTSKIPRIIPNFYWVSEKSSVES